MPFDFNCPHCGGVTRVAEEFAGKHGPCIHCGRAVEIPPAPPSSRRGRGERPRNKAIVRVLGFGAAILAMAVLIGAAITAAIPVWKQARDVALQHRSAANLRKIGLALRAYEADYGSYPPAFTVDSAGKPLLSWRVLILPYLDDKHKQLYDRFDHQLPWNAPQHMQLLREMPEVFVSPADDPAKAAFESTYHVFVGSGTMFPAPDTRRQQEIRDDRATTILVIETSNGVTKWTEPRDVDVNTTDFQIHGATSPILGGNNPAGAQALYADGDVGLIPFGTNAAILEAMTTIDGGEAIGR